MGSTTIDWLFQAPEEKEKRGSTKVVKAQQDILFHCGEDRLGRPTLVACPAVHEATTEEESLRAVEQCMTVVRQTLKEMPSGQSRLIVLYDLGGASSKNMDLVFSRELINRLECTFPGRMERVLVFNSHWSVSYAWNAVSMLLAAETAEKVLFCDSDYRPQLLEYVDANHPYLKRLESKHLDSANSNETSWFGYL